MRRLVAILVFDGVHGPDVAGPASLFTSGQRGELSGPFHPVIVGLTPATVRSESGLKFVPENTLEDCPSPQVILLPGGMGTRVLLHQSSLHEWMRQKARTADAVVAIGAGVLVLARAGLLEGLGVAAKPEMAARLSDLAPTASVDVRAPFVDAGRILTASGTTSGLQCILHLVARLAGSDVARVAALKLQ